jgi:phage terminase large subunit-like protein
MRRIELILPSPYPWQAEVKATRRRFNVGAIGRRAGKTVLAEDLCCEPSVLRRPVAWFAPTYKDMLEVWREVVNVLAPITTRVSASERRIENLAGGVLEFWSLDNVNAGRGRKYARVVIDECAFVPNLTEAWNYTIRPTLVDYEGDAYFFSTPKGRNGFWQLWNRERDDPDWKSWQMPSNVNPDLAQSELDNMRRSLPERVYAQEIDAQFLEDAGNVFRRVVDSATATMQDEPIRDHQYIFGVDWGRSNDFTVVTVLDVTTSELVYMDRFSQVAYETQVGRLKALAQRFQPDAIVAEANSMGGPLVEALQWADLPVQPFTTTNATKQQAIDGLALSFEQGTLRILADRDLINELQSYELERLPSGLLRYGAPDGMHDDCVMSLALAWYGASTTGPLMF